MKKILLLIALLSIGLFAVSQTITTTAATNIAPNSVTFSADATGLDASKTYRVDFWYGPNAGSLTEGPYASSTFTGAITHTFTYDVTGLTSSTNYKYEAYLYVYSTPPPTWTYSTLGGEVPFTTSAPNLATVSTGTVGTSDITTTIITVRNNNVTAEGGSSVTEKGVCAGTSASPTTEFTSLSIGLGTYNISVSGGNENTLYYFRAYAVNSDGTAYGSDINVKTKPGDPTTDAGTDITATTFKANWTVGDGGSTGITYGLDLSKVSDFASFVTGYNNKDVGGVTTYSITDLEVATTYYYRVRAYNDGGDDAPKQGTGNSNVTTVTTGATGLPVELISFIAEVDKGIVNLSWTTASETNNNFFEVQRAYNMSDFETIATVEGSGNSNIAVRYTAKDRDVINGVVYYRLKQVDFDGAHEYSNIIVVTRENIGISYTDFIYDGNKIDFNYHNPDNTATVISLIDNMGRIIQTIEVNNNFSHIVFNTNGLKKGLYVINIVTNNDVLIKKIIL